MRYVAAVAGVLIGVPPLIFFAIGVKTILRPAEKLLAFGGSSKPARYCFSPSRCSLPRRCNASRLWSSPRQF